MVTVAELMPWEEEREAERLWLEIRKDPVSYFSRANRANRATRMGDVISPGFTFFWASGLALNVFTDSERSRTVHLFAGTWPLPVGRQALRDHVDLIRRRNQAGYFGDPSFLGDLMPFDGDELAAVIVDTDVGGCRIEAFGLARVESIDRYRIDTMKFRITGANPHAATVAGYCREIGNWWRILAGQKVKAGGRPEGSTSYTLDEVKAKLRQYRAVGNDLDKTAFLAFCGIPESSWNRYMRTWKTSWTSLKREPF